MNLYVPPGGTVPVTARAGSAASHVPSAKTLLRSRGCVVPMRVLESHVLVPVFFSSMYDGMTWPSTIVIVGASASGKLWLTNCAAYGDGAPYAASTAWAYAMRCDWSQVPQPSKSVSKTTVASVTFVVALQLREAVAGERRAARTR